MADLHPLIVNGPCSPSTFKEDCTEGYSVVTLASFEIFLNIHEWKVDIDEHLF